MKSLNNKYPIICIHHKHMYMKCIDHILRICYSNIFLYKIILLKKNDTVKKNCKNIYILYHLKIYT